VAEPDHKALRIIRGAPKIAVEVFGVLTFKYGELLTPELMTVWDEDPVQFRGRLYGYDKVRILSGDRWEWVPNRSEEESRTCCDCGLVHKVITD